LTNENILIDEGNLPICKRRGRKKCAFSHVANPFIGLLFYAAELKRGERSLINAVNALYDDHTHIHTPKHKHYYYYLKCLFI